MKRSLAIGVALACSLTCCVAAFPAAAAEGYTQLGSALPLRNQAQAGFTITLQTPRRGGPGYQPMRITAFSTAGVFPADRELTIVLRPRNYRRPGVTSDFSTTISLPQGSRSVQQIEYVPRYYPWESISWQVLENGQLVDGCESGTTQVLGAVQESAWTFVGILHPWRGPSGGGEDAFPDLRTLTLVLGEGALLEQGSERRLNDAQARMYANANQDSRVAYRVIDEADAYDSWLGYSQLDILLVSAPLLARIRREQPDRAEQIDRWTVAGGTLWVYGADVSGAVAEGPAGWEPMPVRLVPSESETKSRLESGHPYEPGAFPSAMATPLMTFREWGKLQNDDHPITRIADPAEVAEAVRLRSFGAGQIVWVGQADPFPGSAQFWQAVTEATGPVRLSWDYRHGVNLLEGSDSYWDWLIESVGRPPVYTFLGLISLFVLSIGPVAYRVLRRLDRLYLLFIVAPAAALIATTGLFTYGIVADGFGTRLRLRQVTAIDAASGRGTTWSRQTYFSGLPPRAGLQFSADTAVYPMFDNPGRGGSQAGVGERARSRIRHTGSRQILSGQFLPPRSQQQFMTFRPRTRLGTLSLVRSDGEAAEVSNGTPYGIREALLCTPDGSHWIAGPLTPGGRAVAKRAELGEIALWKSRVHGQQPLAPPAGFDRTALSEMFAGSRRWYYRRGSRRPMPAGTAEYGVLEEMLLARIGPAGALPAGSFIAVAEVDPEDSGVASAEILESIHFLMGELP